MNTKKGYTLIELIIGLSLWALCLPLFIQQLSQSLHSTFLIKAKLQTLTEKSTVERLMRNDLFFGNDITQLYIIDNTQLKRRKPSGYTLILTQITDPNTINMNLIEQTL